MLTNTIAWNDKINCTPTNEVRKIEIFKNGMALNGYTVYIMSLGRMDNCSCFFCSKALPDKETVYCYRDYSLVVDGSLNLFCSECYKKFRIMGAIKGGKFTYE